MRLSPKRLEGHHLHLVGTSMSWTITRVWPTTGVVQVISPGGYQSRTTLAFVQGGLRDGDFLLRAPISAMKENS